MRRNFERTRAAPRGIASNGQLLPTRALIDVRAGARAYDDPVREATVIEGTGGGSGPASPARYATLLKGGL